MPGGTNTGQMVRNRGFSVVATASGKPGMRMRTSESAAMPVAHTRMTGAVGTGAVAARTASMTARTACASCAASPSMGPSQTRNADTHRDTEREFPDRFHDLF